MKDKVYSKEQMDMLVEHMEPKGDDYISLIDFREALEHDLTYGLIEVYEPWASVDNNTDEQEKFDWDD